MLLPSHATCCVIWSVKKKKNNKKYENVRWNPKWLMRFFFSLSHPLPKWYRKVERSKTLYADFPPHSISLSLTLLSLFRVYIWINFNKPWNSSGAKWKTRENISTLFSFPPIPLLSLFFFLFIKIIIANVKQEKGNQNILNHHLFKFV